MIVVTSIEFAVAVVTANMPGTASFLQHVWKKQWRGGGSGGADSAVRRVCGLSGGAAGEAAFELETIGAKTSRKKYVLDNVLESQYNDSPRKTEGEKLSDRTSRVDRINNVGRCN